jgi:protein TonB
MVLERPTSPISSLLAKAVPTAVPHVPFQEISGAESAAPAAQAEERSPLKGNAGRDLTGPESQRGGNRSPVGEERLESEGEGTSGSGSDVGEGDGKGFRGMIGGGSWVGRGGGTGKGGGGDWRVLLIRRIEDAKRYPARARRLEMEGVTEVQFRITRDGTVEGVTVVKSSGFPLLDRASVETIKRAAPFPPIPGTIRVPISYRLRDTR